MTTTHLSRRLGVSQPTTLGFEKSEASKGISLRPLGRAANALGCQLVYALVPRDSLESLVEERALKLAKKHLQAINHNMAPKAQRVEDSDDREHLEQMAQKLLHQPGSELWEDE